MSTSGGPQHQPGTPQQTGAAPPGWQHPAPGGYPQQAGAGYPQAGAVPPGQPYPAQPRPGQVPPGQPGQPPQFGQVPPGQPPHPGHVPPGQPPYPGQIPPGQPPYPAQGYPAPGYPAQSYPQQNPGPLTLPGLGAIPAALGCLLQIVALFVPWVTVTIAGQSSSASFLDIFQNLPAAADGFSAYYVRFISFLVVVVSLLSSLPWTLGALRGKRSAWWLSGIRSRELNQANFWWYRAVFGGRAVVMLIIHIAGVVTMFSKDFSQLGLGGYLLLAGGLLIVAGAAIGPRVNA
ncbi:hypothetical protein [Amycolatopsis benzoatilytica]|uniref:hypothetical protein n=1 Tax=Amycolatopsis benzoatilytica TaxID=346045 RepID=UPI0003A17EBF|nr:hypothetical protein [Amycolatopsis benzoatilytica]